MAKSGEEASFLAGGELPIPLISRDSVRVEFKEFGVRLTFRPEVTDTGAMDEESAIAAIGDFKASRAGAEG